MDDYRNESNLRDGLDLTDQLKVLLRNAMNAYVVSTQSVYQACGVAVNCFQSYLQQLQNSTKDETMKQHYIVFQLLEEELLKIHSAQGKLQEARVSFDEVSEAALFPRLDADYNDYSNQSKQQIERLEEDLKKSRKGILSIVHDNDVTRHLKSTIQEIIKNLVRFEKWNDALKEEIIEAESMAKEMKNRFEDEFNAMIHVKSHAQVAFDTIYIAIKEDDFNFEINNLIKISVEKMINVCRIYRARHE